MSNFKPTRCELREVRRYADSAEKCAMAADAIARGPGYPNHYAVMARDYSAHAFRLAQRIAARGQ